MSTHIAELDPTSSAFADVSASELGMIYSDETPYTIDEPDRPMGTARGILSAVLISIPFWALFAFAIYLMM